jgi:hypothetical protein
VHEEDNEEHGDEDCEDRVGKFEFGRVESLEEKFTKKNKKYNFFRTINCQAIN